MRAGSLRRLHHRRTRRHHRSGRQLSRAIRGRPTMTTIRTAGRAGAFLIPIALVLAACGASSATGAASAAATAGAGEPTTAASPAGPAASAPGASSPAASREASAGAGFPSFAIPSFDIGALTKGLENLDSYRVSLTVKGEEVYKGVVVTKPVLARDLTVKGGTRIVVIGNDAWVSQSGGPLTKVPAAPATGMSAAFDPSLLVGAFSGPEWTQSSLDQGVEQKNGVSAHHYHIDSSTVAGGLTGLPAGAKVDVWIAEKGYLVAFEASGVEGGDISIQVTGVDDPANKVETPS